MEIELFQRLGAALAIGFLVGVERGWHSRALAEGARTAGIRTYTLIGLLGGVSGELSRSLGGWALVAIGFPFAAAFILFKQREQTDEHDHSVTGVVAGLLVFSLGAYATAGDWRAASAAAVAATVLLAFKGVLHAWVEKLTWPELRSALVLLAMTFVALPLLPDASFGPYEAVNPRELWLLTIVIAGLSYVAYAAIKLFGPSRGVLLGAALGSLVSSTVATLDLARRFKAGEAGLFTLTGAALVAGGVMAVRMAAIVAVLAPLMLWRLAPALGAFALVSAGIGLVLGGRGRGQSTGGTGTLQNPFEFGSVLRFAVLLGVLMTAAKALGVLYGAAGLAPLAAAAGLADVDAMTMTAARMSGQGLDVGVAATTVLIAGGANTLSKGAIAGAVGGVRFGAIYIGGSAVAAVAAAAVLMMLT
jgi:uncharacterized membrane protein (DUF4010 family)